MNKTWPLPFSKWKKTRKQINRALCGKCSVRGEVDESPQCFCCEGEGAGRRAGFREEGQRRENVLKVEGHTRTKAEGWKQQTLKGIQGQLRAAASMPRETRGRPENSGCSKAGFAQTSRGLFLQGQAARLEFLGQELMFQSSGRIFFSEKYVFALQPCQLIGWGPPTLLRVCSFS